MTLPRVALNARRRLGGLAGYRSLTTIGIRREDPRRIWERRVPLIPGAVSELVKPGQVAVEVETCSRRCFPDLAYEAVSSSSIRTLEH